jgi:hypothetical protein
MSRVLLAALLASAAAPSLALAQNPPATSMAFPGRQPTSSAASNIGPQDTRTGWAPQLPTPPVGENAPPSAFIEAALKALAAGRTGEAQEAIERAESRVLTRAVAISKANNPSQQPLALTLRKAREALGAGDRQGAVQLLEEAQKNPDAAKAD